MPRPCSGRHRYGSHCLLPAISVRDSQLAKILALPHMHQWMWKVHFCFRLYAGGFCSLILLHVKFVLASPSWSWMLCLATFTCTSPWRGGCRRVGHVEVEVGSVAQLALREGGPTKNPRVLRLCVDLNHRVCRIGLHEHLQVTLRRCSWCSLHLEAPHVARLVGCGCVGQVSDCPHEDGSVGVRPRRASHFLQLLGEGVEPHHSREE